MYRKNIKRGIDFCLALAGFVITFPLLLIIALLLIVVTGKSPFFLQPRPGRNEKIFRVIKFKTMTDKTDKSGNLLPDSARLTKVGCFIRKTSLDEIPQLINVLKGDMSLIGPRPLLVRYLPYYRERERLRHSVRPGITGWAQVGGRNQLGWDERLEKDIWYVEHLSFELDVKIIGLTIKKILKKEGVVVDAHSVMKDLDEERKGYEFAG